MTSSAPRKSKILALVIPGFELLCHSSSIWPWVSYLASLGFESFLCEIGQIYPYPSTVLNKIKSLINLALPSLCKNALLTSCRHPAYNTPLCSPGSRPTQATLCRSFTFQVCGHLICKSCFCFQSFVWSRQMQWTHPEGRRDTTPSSAVRFKGQTHCTLFTYFYDVTLTKR